MNLRSLALAPAFALVFALGSAMPAMAERIPLNELSRYLNSFRTAVADFTQVNPNGSVGTGTVYIQRPGRVRFEYNGDSTLVVASAGEVRVRDGKSNSGPQVYPLARTPLSIILADNIDLGRANMVTGHSEQRNTTVVTAQDPAHPEYGNIQLVFTANPTELRQWVVTDDAGKRTTVILGEMQKGVSIPSSRFVSQ